MKFVSIPSGEFMMGCSFEDPLCSDNEKPPHLVQIRQGFELGTTEVTQSQWDAIVERNPSHFKGESLPVDRATFTHAQLFIARLNEAGDGYHYRLPTEAEWEYAARAGTSSTSSLDDVAWHKANSENRTHPVASKEPNAWGLYDMLGNVWEWTQDWYNDLYYSQSPAADPLGPEAGTRRSMRGGSWISSESMMRPAARYSYGPESTSDTWVIGFRVVRERLQP